MEPRLDDRKFASGILNSLLSLEKRILESGIDRGLLYLIKMWTPQFNGCELYLNLHSKYAPLDDEATHWIALLSAWWECTQSMDKDMVALEWAERVALISKTRNDDKVHGNLKTFFMEEEIVVLTWAIIITINSWSRLDVSFEIVP